MRNTCDVHGIIRGYMIFMGPINMMEISKVIGVPLVIIPCEKTGFFVKC